MKNILVPIDFSENSINAVEVAAQIAKKANSRLILLHAVNFPVHEGENMAFPGQEHTDVAEVIFYMKLVKKKFHKLMQQPFLEGVSVIEAIQEGEIVEAILKHADEHAVDLIVIGSHGPRGIYEKIIGSNAENLVRHTTIPTIVVKEKAASFTIKKVLFSTDFEESTKAFYHKIKPLLLLYKPEIHFAGVITPGNFMSSFELYDRVHQFVSEVGEANAIIDIITHPKIDEGINELVSRKSIDFIILQEITDNDFRHLFKRADAEQIEAHTKVPVLICK